MTTTATKSIAARLPYQEYIRVLQAAVEAKLTVSDYLILQLQAGEQAGEQLIQNQTQLAALQKQAVQLRQEVNQTKKAHQNTIDTLGQWQARSQQWEAKEKEARQQIATLRDSSSQWEKQTAELTREKATLTKQVSTSGVLTKAQEQRIAELTTAHTELTQAHAKLTLAHTELTNSTTNLTQANADLTAANATLQHQLTQSQTVFATIKKNAQAMNAALWKEHNSSTIKYIHKPYWAIIDRFISSLDTKP